MPRPHLLEQPGQVGHGLGGSPFASGWGCSGTKVAFRSGSSVVPLRLRSPQWGQAEADLQLSSPLGLAPSSALSRSPHFLLPPAEPIPLRDHLHQNPVSGSASRVTALDLQHHQNRPQALPKACWASPRASADVCREGPENAHLSHAPRCCWCRRPRTPLVLGPLTVQLVRGKQVPRVGFST